MIPEITRIGSIAIRTYTLLLDVGILTGLALLAWAGWRAERRPNAWLDAGLGALVGGIIAGRLVHVAVHWAYFSEHLVDALRIWQGGISWHGAVIGGLTALWLASRWRRVDVLSALGALVYALPIGAALVYNGCLASGCAYGQEVASLAGYPPIVVAELPDLFGIVVPRYASQLYGAAWSLLLIAASWPLTKWIRQPGPRFFIMLALIAAGAFGVGFWRGDVVPAVGPLRLDQALDLLIIALSIAGIIVTARMRPAPDAESPATAPA